MLQTYVTSFYYFVCYGGTIFIIKIYVNTRVHSDFALMITTLVEFFLNHNETMCLFRSDETPHSVKKDGHRISKV